MKESYGEGLASHTGPESCVGRRKAAGEALTGVHADQPLSSEITPFGTPTLLSEAEGNIACDDSRESQASPAVLNLRINGLFFSDYLGLRSLFSRCLDRAGQPGSELGG